MKKIFILIIFIFSFLIILSGCSHEEVSSINQDKVDEVIYYIDDLPSNIKISHKDSVYYIMDMYNELNDEEKKLVTNYQKLKDAYNKIQAFENEDSLMESILKTIVFNMLYCQIKQRGNAADLLAATCLFPLPLISEVLH